MEHLLPSPLVLNTAAAAAVICCLMVLFPRKGRPGNPAPLGAGAAAALAGPALLALGPFLQGGNPLLMLAGLLLFCLTGLSVLLVPALTAAGLAGSAGEEEFPGSRHRRAGLVLAAWILGTLLPLLRFLEGIGGGAC